MIQCVTVMGDVIRPGMSTAGTSASGASRRRDYVDAHDHLLSAAGELFAAGGPEAVSVSAVAERAGVSRATVHRHIGTRAELLWEVTGRLFSEMGVGIDRPLDQAGIAEGVERLIDTLVGDPARSRRALLDLLGTPEEPPDSNEPTDGDTLLTREVAMMRILAAGNLGQPGIDAEVLAVVNLAGMLLWSVLAERGVVAGGPEQFRSEIVRLLLHGAIDQDALTDLARPMGVRT